MNRPELNVSGQWTGAFTYPRLLATVTFEASLDEALGVIAGATDELTRFHEPQLRVAATLQGRRNEVSVSWVKRYEAPRPPSYDYPVIYEGTLSTDGMEIRGLWRLPGFETGSFLMIRAVSLEAERERAAEAAVAARR
jgi:hypothetical protein